MTKIRDFLTIEQALAHCLKDLKDDEIKQLYESSRQRFNK